jgi:ankyrin repeat protein
VVKAAARNKYGSKEVIAFLLNQRGHQVTITEEIIKAVIGNKHCGKKVMMLLLNQREVQITITGDIIQAAAAYGQDNILDLLSQHDSIILDWDKWRCISNFYNAAKTGDVCCIKQLINKVIDLDMKNIKGKTPLWVAAKNGYEAVVKVLAQEKNVDINSISVSRRSPLFWPSCRGYERIVAILMEAGADPHFVDKNGHTAITIAKTYGHSRIVKILERVG